MKIYRTIAIVLLFAIYFQSSLYAQFYYWEVIGTMHNNKVAGATACLNGNEIYLIGGFSDSTQTPVNWIQHYDIYSNTWSNISNLEFSRFGHVTACDEDFFYTYGGVHSADSIKNTLERWVPGSSSTVVAENINFDRIYSTGQLNGDNLYIIGGHQYLGGDAFSLPYIIEYSISQDKILWSSDLLNFTGILPEQQMSAKLGNDIFIFGGVYNGIENKITKFNMETHEQEIIPVSLLGPRAAGEAIAFEEFNQILIIGGYNENNSALASVEVLTKIGDKYTIESVSPLNFSRSSFASIKSGENIFIFGGYNAEQMLVSEIEFFSSVATDVTSEFGIVKEFELSQNYPNPFNPTTVINYHLPNRKASVSVFSHVKLAVYDLLGREVAILVDNFQESGNYQVKFNAGNLPSGMYIYSLQSGSFYESKKMILLK